MLTNQPRFSLVDKVSELSALGKHAPRSRLVHPPASASPVRTISQYYPSHQVSNPICTQMLHSRALTVITTSDPQHNQVIKNGAGRKYIDAFKSRLLGRRGPVAAVLAVEAFFGNEDERLERLDELYLLRHSEPTSNNDRSRIAISGLKKLCSQVLSYTRGCGISCIKFRTTALYV